MTEQLVEGRCPFSGGGNNGFGCFTTKSMPVAKAHVELQLQQEVKVVDVRDLLCNSTGGAECPVKRDLDILGIRSMYAKPT